MIGEKIVQRFGNGGHVVLPKEYIGKRIQFILGPKTFEDLKIEILEILKPYLENILGIYLYGSYARNEHTINSDVDVLVISNAKLKIADKIHGYSTVSTTIAELESTLRKNAVLVLPIIKEAKTIINPDLLEKYKGYKFTRKNTKWFIDNSAYVLELNEKGIGMDFEIGSLIYSLMLRIRGLLMIKLMLNGKLYSKSSLFSDLRDNKFSQDKIEELYRVYSEERENTKIIESGIISKEDISKLLSVAKNLLSEVRSLLR
ncbi:DUF2080 family transposase-associated protein [Candidatus Woesearchaeota archaeon]|nr:DUF2080 family transposase-associated protein [Candidatus Woesearchaeota archaeon]